MEEIRAIENNLQELGKQEHKDARKSLWLSLFFSLGEQMKKWLSVDANQRSVGYRLRG